MFMPDMVFKEAELRKMFALVDGDEIIFDNKNKQLIIRKNLAKTVEAIIPGFV